MADPVASSALISVFAIYLLTQFIEDIPDSLCEAGRLCRKDKRKRIKNSKNLDCLIELLYNRTNGLRNGK